MNSKKDPIEKEWFDLIKKEERFNSSRMKSKPEVLNEKLDRHIPEKLRSTLDIAFNKAFEVIFIKGTGIIGKTLNREEYEYDYKVKEYALSLRNSRKNIRKFSKKAGLVKSSNMVVSGVSGVGMGLLGVGIPDIPVFTSMLLRSIYGIAMSFGFDYDETEEKLFVLKLIEISMKCGVDFADANTELNKLIDEKQSISVSLENQIKMTSKELADAMIYMKFIQGIPIVGAVGGSYDFIYMNRILTYAMLKYKRRFIVKKGVSNCQLP